MTESDKLAGTGLRRRAVLCALLLSVWSFASLLGAAPKRAAQPDDPYKNCVWPPPPDEPRIKLVAIISGRGDVEAKSKFSKTLIGAGPQGPYDTLQRPIGVAFDREGRILVTDSGSHALMRFDRKGRVMDVFGTKGSLQLRTPLGVSVGSGGEIYVADPGLGKVVEFDSKGAVKGAFGRDGELLNPTDSAMSRDGKRLYVVDSKLHQVVVFDIASRKKVGTIGQRGSEPGEFNFPTSISVDPGGDLFVVDQINARVQLLSESGESLDMLGGLGTGFGEFVRPKDVAVDSNGLVYVTDAAFNNLQLFDAELHLLTFVGQGGVEPGQFQVAGSVDVRDGEFAVVDQLNRRVQLFQFLPVPADAAKEVKE